MERDGSHRQPKERASDPVWDKWDEETVLEVAGLDQATALAIGLDVGSLVDWTNMVAKHVLDALWQTRRSPGRARRGWLPRELENDWRSQVLDHARQVMAEVLPDVRGLADVAHSDIRGEKPKTDANLRLLKATLQSLKKSATLLERIPHFDEEHDRHDTVAVIGAATERIEDLIYWWTARIPGGWREILCRICQRLISCGRCGLAGVRPITDRYRDDRCRICNPPNLSNPVDSDDELALLPDPAPHPTLRHAGMSQNDALQDVATLYGNLGIKPQKNHPRRRPERGERVIDASELLFKRLKTDFERRNKVLRTRIVSGKAEGKD